jgi:DNA-binding NarL/FixJ family response regulator
MIDLLVVDDHKIFRAGLQRMISDEQDVRVADEAPDGGTALAKLRQRRFDVVLLDVNLPGRNGFEVLESIRAERPDLPVIMLSMYPEEQYAVLALRSRANAYLSKDADPQELLAAIREVARGGRYVSPRTAAHVLMQLDRPSSAQPHEKLSPRELQIMLKIVGGVSLTEIGAQMALSVKTVATYRGRILEKLALSSNAELVQYAMRQGLVS